MTDEATPGDKLDALLVDLRAAADDVRARAAARGEQLSDEFQAAIDALSDKVDEVQAAWEARESE